MLGPNFRPDVKTSRFMALTGSDFTKAHFCLEAADNDFSSALGVFAHVGELKFQDKPPEDHIENDNDLNKTTLAVVGTALTFALVDGRVFSNLATGFMVLATIGSFLAGVPDVCNQHHCRREERQGWRIFWPWD